MNHLGPGYGGGMIGRRGESRRARVLVAVLLVALGDGTLGGCVTGKPSSVSSWQSSSHRAIGEAISALSTARVVIEQERGNRMPHTYSVVAVTDVIETSGKEISSYERAQPPDELHEANATVGDALDKASSILVDVRVTLASPGLTAESARQLISKIDAMREQLDQLDGTVMKSPGSVGAK